MDFVKASSDREATLMAINIIEESYGVEENLEMIGSWYHGLVEINNQFGSPVLLEINSLIQKIGLRTLA